MTRHVTKVATLDEGGSECDLKIAATAQAWCSCGWRGKSAKIGEEPMGPVRASAAWHRVRAGAGLL